MPTVVDFAYTGAMQSVVVPSGVESAVLEVWGASGQDGAAAGGMGAYVQATIEGLTPGETLYVFVGGAGAGVVGGYNGGGNGMTGTANYTGGGGGGATDIRRGGSTLADRIIVAGGGGGAAYRTANAGGSGGYPTGGTGGGGILGGTQVGPGISSTLSQNTEPAIGELGAGGDCFGGGTRKIGGGGGGLYGGNSGNGGSSFNSGGGGGSSYYDPGLTSVTATSSAASSWDGHGKATITFADPSNIGAVDLGPLTATATAAVSRTRRRRPRREYLWVRDLSGEQIGVIR